jgi:hypothetical protein
MPAEPLLVAPGEELNRAAHRLSATIRPLQLEALSVYLACSGQRRLAQRCTVGDKRAGNLLKNDSDSSLLICGALLAKDGEFLYREIIRR